MSEPELGPTIRPESTCGSAPTPRTVTNLAYIAACFRATHLKFYLFCPLYNKKDVKHGPQMPRPMEARMEVFGWLGAYPALEGSTLTAWELNYKGKEQN